MPRLLFVTDSLQLAAAVGETAARIAVELIRDSGQPFVEAPGPELPALTRSALSDDPDIAGVVLIGGYTVVPSERAKALPLELRDLRFAELDQFWVWSDDGYGDRDGDLTPELPVTRIPDGGSPALLFRSLGHAGLERRERSAGVRNLARPFAEEIFEALPNRHPLNVSAPLAGGGLPPFALDADLLYVMLHGHYADTASFSGEDLLTGDYPVAVSIEHLPRPGPLVVFAGCCWGALIVQERAMVANGGDLHALTPDASIALRCLLNGANAFVGCTGAHYSPDWPDLDNYGGPLHRFFWEEVLTGAPPAQALFRAKTRYADGIPHNPEASRAETALEYKILRQFTCLGMGW